VRKSSFRYSVTGPQHEPVFLFGLNGQIVDELLAKERVGALAEASLKQGGHPRTRPYRAAFKPAQHGC